MSSINKIPEHLHGMLRSIGMLYDESTFPGKVHYNRTATLDIEFSAGCMVDFQTWVPSQQHKEYFGKKVLPAYREIMVKITLDDEVIYNQAMSNETINLQHRFSDNSEQTHSLTVQVSGSFNQHSRTVEGIGFVSHMLKIQNIWIENLCMKNILEDKGRCVFDDQPDIKNTWSEVLGQPGCQHFEFSSPIYPWLLDNEKHPNYYKMLA